LVIKTLGPDWIRIRIRIHFKCWIRIQWIRIPQHWFAGLFEGGGRVRAAQPAADWERGDGRQHHCAGRHPQLGRRQDVPPPPHLLLRGRRQRWGQNILSSAYQQQTVQSLCLVIIRLYQRSTLAQ